MRHILPSRPSKLRGNKLPLISARKDADGVREEICADSLAFLSPGALLRAGNRKDLCMACFTGHYPTALYQSVDEVNKDVKC